MTDTDSLNNDSIFHYNVIHYLTEQELLCIFSPDTVFCLQMFLVFCPNILMCFAFVLWGVSEGQCFTTFSHFADAFIQSDLQLGNT